VAITSTGGKLHWNYFVALDSDLETASRYVEFTEANFGVFSIELAHLLFAAASEVDVVAKLVCEQLAPGERWENINHYKSVLLPAIPTLPATTVYVPRYGLSFMPWDNWSGATNPDWWRAYNDVKHERDRYFNQATLKNVLNSLGALLILSFHYYARSLKVEADPLRYPREVTRQLLPEPSLIRFDESWYDQGLRV